MCIYMYICLYIFIYTEFLYYISKFICNITLQTWLLTVLLMLIAMNLFLHFFKKNEDIFFCFLVFYFLNSLLKGFFFQKEKKHDFIFQTIQLIIFNIKKLLLTTKIYQSLWKFFSFLKKNHEEWQNCETSSLLCPFFNNYLIL